MTATFTQELTFGPWASGMMVDGGSLYRTIQPTSAAPPVGGNLLTGQDLFDIRLGQSNTGNQGTAGQTPVQTVAYSLAAMLALIAGTDDNVKIWNTGPSGVINQWQNYQVGVNSNPLQNSPQTTVTGMAWAAGTVTLTATAHGLSNGANMRVSGVTPAAYNGTYTATVLDANTITYALVSNPGVVTVQGKVNLQQYWGAELQEYAYLRTKFPSMKIFCYKQAPGGAQLYDGADIPSWNSRHTVATTSHWDLYKTWLAAAKASASFTPTAGYFTKLVWTQGETEASASSGSLVKANAYQTDLTNFVNDNDTYNGRPDLFVISQLFGTTTGNPVALTNNYTWCDTVRAAEAAVATLFGSRCALVDQSPAWTTANGSGIHYPNTSIDGDNGTAARETAVLILPEVTTVGSLAGTRQVGQTATYTPAAWTFIGSQTKTWVWKINGATVQTGGTTYTYQSGDAGYTTTIVETMTGPLGATTSTLSDGTTIAVAPAYDAATVALVNAAVAAGGSAPSGGREAAIDALIVGLKTDIGNAGDSSTVWSHIVALEIIAGHDEIFAQMEWKGATKKGAIFAGSPTFVVDQGYTLNGTSQSLTTGLNPTTLALAQNQAGFGLWIAAGTGTTAACGINGSTGNRFGFNKAGSGAISAGCSANATTVHNAITPPARALHHYLQRNNDASNIDYYFSGALDPAQIRAQTSASVQNADLLLGQNGTTPTFVADRYFAIYFTDGNLDAAGVANLHTRLSTYKTTLGA